jgi:hypothetical protein
MYAHVGALQHVGIGLWPRPRPSGVLNVQNWSDSRGQMGEMNELRTHSYAYASGWRVKLSGNRNKAPVVPPVRVAWMVSALDDASQLTLCSVRLRAAAPPYGLSKRWQLTASGRACEKS